MLTNSASLLLSSSHFVSPSFFTPVTGVCAALCRPQNKPGITHSNSEEEEEEAEDEVSRGSDAALTVLRCLSRRAHVLQHVHGRQW
ncbi:hypothetical protein JOB18_016209 [Solea senegalensis]|uniref:Secreted protein n=1 Tax=Solea senegalensis TaxID=28829 RepID=A0AAV6QF72_SOLSE|nr:hypothetical protein JOB18_016209 [Solea senegalensis]